MTNYVRVTPVCSAKMFSLKDKDPETWSMFNKVPFLLIKHLFRFLLLVYITPQRRKTEQSNYGEALTDSAP